MKKAYLDTNVFVARFKPNDPSHESCTQVLSSQMVDCFASGIVVAELISVVSRQLDELELDELARDAIKDLSREDKAVAIASYILSMDPVRFESHIAPEMIYLNGKAVTMFSDYARVFSLAPFFRLKCLDNLHIAAVKNIMLSKNLSLDYFVTMDKEILSKRQKITTYIGCTVVNPDTLVDLEGILGFD